MITKLQLDMNAKDVENRNLHAQLATAHAEQQEQQQEGIDEEALRKRLQRLCERKKNG